jgi:tetraacyldisaccharide 4'-kinase
MAVIAPDFWRTGRGPWPIVLQPVGALWNIVSLARRAGMRHQKTSVPVICVGNLTAGGSGKTPVALALAARLGRRGVRCHFLIRGYGGSLTGPLKVDAARHAASEVGDEALLLAAAAATWIGADRAASAKAAVDDGAEALIMDDGFQNPGLAKDLSVIVIDRAYGFGNGRVIPAGPLREFAVDGFARAHAVIALDGGDGGEAKGWRPLVEAANLPILEAALEPDPDAERLSGQRLLAFAGIGRPQKFFASLDHLGCEVVERRAFADHHAYSDDDIMRLVEDAAALQAKPVTTAKDFARLPAEARPMVEVLGVGVEFLDAGAPDRLLDPILQGLRKAHG